MSLTLERSRISAPPQRNLTLWLLFAGWLAQATIRFWLARHQVGPVANPDEAGYLVAARRLAGGPGADLSRNTFYQGGYPLLLTPIFWLTSDPATAYRLVMLVNALVGALAFPLAHLGLRRLGAENPLLAWVAALLPAVVIFGRFALADAILPVVVLGWLLAMDHFLRTRTRGSAVIAGLTACFAYTVHARGSVILAVHVLTLILLVRKATRPVLIGLAITATGYLAAARFNAFLLADLYPSGARDLGGNLLSRLSTVDGQAWALSGAAGQIWYMIVASWGLAGVGLAAVVAAAARRNPIAWVLCAATFGIAYGSMAALPDENRVGNFAYGRYLTCVALVYTLIGLKALTNRRAVLAAVLILAGTGEIVELYAGARLHSAVFIPFDFPEIIMMTQDDTGLRLGLASGVALAMLAALTIRPMIILPLINLVVLVVITTPFAAGSSPYRPDLPHTGVITDRQVPWQVRAALFVPISWTKIGWYRAGDPVPPGVCTVIVPWPAGTPLDTTWPGHPTAWTPATIGDGAAAWKCPAPN
jgi:hypothetical protein